MIEVEAPDGSIVEFPEGTDNATMERAMRETFGGPSSGQQASGYGDGAFRAATEGAQSGMMFGFDDELTGAMLAPIEATKNWLQGDGFDLGGAYTSIRDQENARKQSRRDAHPVASFTGELAGGMATAGSAAQKGLTLAGRNIPMLSNTGKAVLESGAYGAAYGAGESDPGERGKGALWGAGIGMGTGYLGSKIGDKIVNRQANKGLDTSDILKDQASQLYTASENAGVAIKGQSLKRTIGNLKLKMAPQIKNERLYGETIGIIDYLDDQAKGTLRLRDIDELRQVVADSISDASKREKRTLMIIKDSLDDYISKLKPGDVAAGNIRDGVEFLGQARDMYSRHLKQEVIEEIFHKARNQATGFENGLRVHFRALANNKKRFAQFNKEEQQAILRVVRGGPIENALRAFAWFSPQKTLGAVATGLMASEGGIGPASAMAGAGMAATRAAEKATMKNVRGVEHLLQNINSQSVPIPIQHTYPAISGSASKEWVRR